MAWMLQTSEEEHIRCDVDRVVRGQGGSGQRRVRRAGRMTRGRGLIARRSRGRGGRDQTPNRAEIAATARVERSTELKERINNLPEESVRELLFDVTKKYPALVFDVLEAGSRTRVQQGYHPSPDQGGPNWCSCRNCREMPTEAERLCCGQLPENCFSRIRDFDLVVLDELILHVARTYRQDVLAVPNDNDWNRGNRHTAYRQYILWQHGRLGAGNRRVIPSCCVWRIRDTFPDPFGQYSGFVHGRLA